MFTPQMDQILLEAVNAPQYRGLSRERKWAAIGRLFPGIPTDTLVSRWSALRGQRSAGGAKSLLISAQGYDVPSRARSSSSGSASRNMTGGTTTFSNDLSGSLKVSGSAQRLSRPATATGNQGTGIQGPSSNSSSYMRMPDPAARGGTAGAASSNAALERLSRSAFSSTTGNDNGRLAARSVGDSGSAPLRNSIVGSNSIGQSVASNQGGSSSALKPVERATASIATASSRSSTVSSRTADRRLPPSRNNSKDVIVIHVCDEANDVERDFYCDRKTLVSEMKYFESYLADEGSCDDLDISVHCDVNVFQWLMSYVMNKTTDPDFDNGSVVSILISSHFLCMSRLVAQSLKYVKDHLADIVRLPIDLDCIGADLLMELSELFTVEELNEVRDRRDKILGKLFMIKLEQLLDDPSHHLYRCTLCGKLFTQVQKEASTCTNAKVFVDFHGNVIAEHVEDEAWDVNKYFLRLRQNGLTWRDIYWRTWGLVHTLRCKRCRQSFVLSELEHCSFHPSTPTFAGRENVGVYPCCGAKALRFDSGNVLKRGCMGRQHVVDEGDSVALLATVEKFRDLILVPFGGPQSFAGGDIGLDNGHSGASSDVDGDRSDDEMIHVKKLNGEGEEEDTDSDSDFASDYSSSDSDRPLQRKPMKRASSLSKMKKKRKKKKASSSSRHSSVSPKRKHIWRLDVRRDEDAARLEAVVAQLQSLRQEKKGKQSGKDPVSEVFGKRDYSQLYGTNVSKKPTGANKLVSRSNSAGSGSLRAVSRSAKTATRHR